MDVLSRLSISLRHVMATRLMLLSGNTYLDSVLTPNICSDMATAETPDIRGALRAELVRDLALGELSHEQLGEKYSRYPQAISNFAGRNRDEIRRAKQVQSDEYQGLGYAEKWERLTFREQLLRDIEERLQDPDLSDTQRNRYAHTAEKLLHGIAEERGQLTRSIRQSRRCPVRTLSRGAPSNGTVLPCIRSRSWRWMVGDNLITRMHGR
jgi:hypothetical protein